MNTATYTVRGMTCGHCVTAVTEEMAQIPGVSNVSIDLVEGGDSSVVVTSAEQLSLDAVREAVDEAGYELVS